MDIHAAQLDAYSRHRRQVMWDEIREVELNLARIASALNNMRPASDVEGDRLYYAVGEGFKRLNEYRNEVLGGGSEA